SVVVAALAVLVVGIVAMVIWQRKQAEERAVAAQQAFDRLSEANNLIQNSRWHSDAGEWAKAHGDLTRAVELRPDHSLVWFERGDFYLRLELWDLAAADYARAVQLQKATTLHQWFAHALLRAYVGDMESYRRVAIQLPERFRDFPESVYGNELARACTL